MRHATAREADAGFFEDWSTWASLDGGRPPRAYLIPYPQHGYYLVAVNGATAHDLVARIPGAALGRRSRHHLPAGPFRVPAAQWRRLQAIAPRLAQLCTARRAEQDRDAARRRAEHERMAGLRP